ncbi:SPOR domain-containing protein [Sphingomonas sp. J344]|uniref:SPOR domain-containing protein n=1 Tax=Sphingomonas sp. J344 TaxID=2898434 RepID=UPI002150BB9F|nr:SPOR domain-containing protein [Sphingomonas sp. J344]MCR5871726.1 SPOR domain-containing protein [Sphingomonas sp. J344]
MVRSERPGEALRLFALAERGGVAMEPYASDRGLAYDLIGAQAHAQREHRIAMARDGDDETARRFAYSLGISGRTDEAMKILDPLLRRSDRAAWRARAFILAMNGDAAGADRIAATMMGGVGTALAPFFRRLPTLAAADKAFAVHFGELRRTPSRVADAANAPPLPFIAPERVASAPPPPAVPAATPAARPERRLSARERRAQEAAAAKQAAADAEAKRLADARAAQEAETRRQAEAARLAEQQRLEMERVAAAQRQAEAARLAEAERAAQAQREADARVAQERAAREAEARRAAEAATASAAQPAAPPPIAVARAPEVAPEPEPAPTTPSEPASRPAAPRVGAEDNVIARIMAGIVIPASELEVAPLPGREPTPAPAPAPAPEVAQPKSESVAKPPAKPAAKPATAKTDPKAKPKPKVDPAKAEPVRHWVQVAGGADVKALPKAWKAAVADAPAEFRGKQAWTTPLRFTNRLLAGPFKTPAAAQDFVNAIRKKGVEAFAWTSEAGQKIEKLPVN